MMGMDINLEMVMQTIGWWLKTMEQGMWKAPLQFAENTVCIGWLLYLAEEYDQESLVP